MPHASFCLGDKGHFSKRNIRSLFLVLIPCTACHNAFTFCPYIWICNPSCAFEEGMQTLFFDFWVSVGHWVEQRVQAACTPAAASPVTHGPRPQLRWPSPGKGLFPGAFLPFYTSLPSQSASLPTEAKCQTAVDGGTLSTPPFPCIFLPPLVDSGKCQKFSFSCLDLL